MKKVKSIGIVTLNGNFNFGNRLQAYALNYYLNQQGFNTKTLLFKETNKTITLSSFNNNSKLSNWRNKLYVALKLFINFIKYLIRIKHNLYNKKRTKLFLKFTQHYISEHNVVDSSKLNDIFDIFIVGSDQVWNPLYSNNLSRFLLHFAHPKKRFAFSASFGLSFLPSEYHHMYKESLTNFKNISVREKTGQSILLDLIDKSPLITLDPTFLISQTQWENIVSSSSLKIPEKYILVYFLGTISNEYRSFIRDYSRKLNIPVIDLLNIDKPYYYCVSPESFLKLIKNSTFFFTDSFHGVVFSIIFRKQFVVFKRIESIDIYSRIEYLLSTFKLGSRVFDSSNTSSIDKPIDFTEVIFILDEEIKISKDFLRSITSNYEE
jgi:hypothetical protein